MDQHSFDDVMIRLGIPEMTTDPHLLEAFIERMLFDRSRLHTFLARFLPNAEAPLVLEVGCGSGLNLQHLHRAAKVEGYGIDLSREALRLAHAIDRRLGGEALNLMQVDADSLPFPSNTFDLVFSEGVMEHFPDAEPMLQEQIRVLRPNGVLVIDVPQKYNLYTLSKHKQIKNGTWPWGWETEYSYWDIVRIAKKHDLDVLGADGNGYTRYASILRYFFHKVQQRSAATHMTSMKPLNRILTACQYLWDGLWSPLERFFGPYYMVNVSVALRKRSTS